MARDEEDSCPWYAPDEEKNLSPQRQGVIKQFEQRNLRSAYGEMERRVLDAKKFHTKAQRLGE